MLQRKKQQNLFCEKKKQKTFAPAPALPAADVRKRARGQTDKSFLVLFFKKEHLTSSPYGDHLSWLKPIS
jgi:hypothetical protein